MKNKYFNDAIIGGKDMARILAKKADELVLVARNVEKLEEIKKELEKDAKIDAEKKAEAIKSGSDANE